MPFVEDLSAFFAETDFAQTAKITLQTGATRNVSVIFDGSMQVVSLYETNVEANTPQFQCQSRDLAGVRTKDSVSIGGKNYSIERMEADGTGVSTVYLKTI